MCGRFSLVTTGRALKMQFGLEDVPDFPPRYNIAPGQDILFLCKPENSIIQPLILRWGLIPFWAKDKKIGMRLVNARAETVALKPAFRNSFKFKRGIVVMSGFFEWHQGVYKQPYYIKSKKNNLLAVAALWDSWQSEKGEVVQSCCLITTEANQMMSPIHNRMPVILNKEEQGGWLNPSIQDTHALLGLLKPCPENKLVSYPVTTKMNNARFSSSEAIEPVSLT